MEKTLDMILNLGQTVWKAIFEIENDVKELKTKVETLENPKSPSIQRGLEVIFNGERFMECTKDGEMFWIQLEGEWAGSWYTPLGEPDHT